MTPQLLYGLKQGAFTLILAALAIAVGLATENFGNEVWLPVIVALAAGAKRAIEGYADGIRAKEGLVFTRDVGAFAEPLKRGAGGRQLPLPSAGNDHPYH